MSENIPHWYVNQKGKALGPFSLNDLKSLAAGGRLKGHDLVFKDGSPQWRKAYDWPELAGECFGEENRSSFDRLLQTPEDERAIENQWVLLVREDMEREVRFRQRGPYSTEEVRRLIREEKVKPSDHAWKKGDTGWRPLYELSDFKVHDLKMTPEAREALRKVEDMPSRDQVEDLLLSKEPPAQVLPTPGPLVSPNSVVRESVPLFLGVHDEEVRNEVAAIPEFSDHPIIQTKSQPPLPPRDIPPAPSLDEEFPPLIIHSKPAHVRRPSKFRKQETHVEVPSEGSSNEAGKPQSGVALGEAEISPEGPLTKTAPRVQAPRRGLVERTMPLLALSLIAVFGLGIWATLQTDRSAFQKQSLSMGSSVAPSPEATSEAPSAPPLESVKAEVPPVPVVSKPIVNKREAAQTGDTRPMGREGYDGKNPIVRLSEDQQFLEIIAPFRKGDLLRMRIEGRPGQILDIPALVQRFEFRASADNLYRLKLSEFKIPRGEYLVSVQYGMTRFNRGVGLGKETPEYNDELKNHRKMISYDQQQERRRLIQATRELGGLLQKAEGQVRDGGAMNAIVRDLEKKIPRELRMVRSNRHELMFSSHWEKLAAQWEKTQQSLKLVNPNRNPASISEITKARKATASIENEARNSSFWD